MTGEDLLHQFFDEMHTWLVDGAVHYRRCPHRGQPHYRPDEPGGGAHGVRIASSSGMISGGRVGVCAASAVCEAAVVVRRRGAHRIRARPRVAFIRQAEYMSASVPSHVLPACSTTWGSGPYISQIFVCRAFEVGRPCQGSDYAAREKNCSAAVRLSPLSSTTSCHFLSMCMRSMPTSVLWAASNDLNPSMGRVTRLTARWSCSTILFKYFTCRMMMWIRAPHCRS
jgi:hypothetical protein